MKLPALLEIAKQYKNLNSLNEAYSNGIIQNWQNQIWDSYFYNSDFIDNRDQRKFIKLISNYKIEQLFSTLYFKVREGTNNEIVKKAICNITKWDNMNKSALYYNSDVAYQLIKNKKNWRIQPIASLIRKSVKTIAKRESDPENEPLFGYKLTEIKDSDLEVIPFESYRSRKYSQYIMFFTTVNNELFAISYNNKIIMTFENPGPYSTPTWSFMNRPPMEQCPDIPEECIDDSNKFYAWLEDILKPWYKKWYDNTILCNTKDIKERHNTTSTAVFKDLTTLYGSTQFFCGDQLGVIYGVDMAKNNHYEERINREDYRLWVAKQKDMAFYKRREMRDLISKCKKVKEYINLQDDIETKSDTLFDIKDLVMTVTSKSLEDSDNKENFLKTTYNYNVTYYKGVTLINNILDKMIDTLYQIMESIQELGEFNNIKYAKDNSSELQPKLAIIKSKLFDYNDYVTKLIQFKDDTLFFDKALKQYPNDVNRQVILKIDYSFLRIRNR